MRLFRILFLLVGVVAYGQKPQVDQVNFDQKTTAERDALTTPTGRTTLIYNSDTGQFEFKPAAGSWTAIAGGGGGGITWSSPVDANIIPGADNTYDLGSAAASFNDLWVDGVANLAGITQIGATLPVTGTLAVNGAFYTTHKGNSLFLGQDAGFSDDGTDNDNVGVGRSVLFSNTTGAFNVGVGRNALLSSVSASNNTAVGYDALGAVTSGDNFAGGYRAGVNLLTSFGNVLVGSDAARVIADGVTDATTLNNSVIIGSDAKPSANSVTNEIVVGYNAEGNGSNTATWGNTSITDHYFSGALNLPNSNYGDISIDSSQWLIGENVIDSLNIADGAVTTFEILNGTITNADLTTGLIEADNLEATNAPTDGFFPSYDVTTGGFTWEAVSGATDSGSGYDYTTISSSTSFTNANVTDDETATGKKIWNRVTANSTITIDNDSVSLALTGNPFIIQNWGADSTIVKPGPGTSFYFSDSTAAMTSPGIVIKARHPVSVLKTDAAGFFLQGNFGVLGSTVTDFHTEANAANNDNEANDTAGFSNGAGSTLGITSTTPLAGTYSITSLAITGSGGERIGYSLIGKVTNGQSITISFDYQAGSTAQLTAWQGLGSTSGKSITANGTTQTYSETVTVTDATIAAIRWYPGTTIGEGWKIDNLQIILN